MVDVGLQSRAISFVIGGSNPLDDAMSLAQNAGQQSLARDSEQVFVGLLTCP